MNYKNIKCDNCNYINIGSQYIYCHDCPAIICLNCAFIMYDSFIIKFYCPNCSLIKNDDRLWNLKTVLLTGYNILNKK